MSFRKSDYPNEFPARAPQYQPQPQQPPQLNAQYADPREQPQYQDRPNHQYSHQAYQEARSSQEKRKSFAALFALLAGIVIGYLLKSQMAVIMGYFGPKKKVTGDTVVINPGTESIVVNDLDNPFKPIDFNEIQPQEHSRGSARSNKPKRTYVPESDIVSKHIEFREKTLEDLKQPPVLKFDELADKAEQELSEE
jgi:hypothetical protein